MWPHRIDNRKIGPVVRLGWLGYELVQRDRLPVMMCVCYSTELYCSVTRHCIPKSIEGHASLTLLTME